MGMAHNWGIQYFIQIDKDFISPSIIFDYGPLSGTYFTPTSKENTERKDCPHGDSDRMYYLRFLAHTFSLQLDNHKFVV